MRNPLAPLAVFALLSCAIPMLSMAVPPAEEPTAAAVPSAGATAAPDQADGSGPASTAAPSQPTAADETFLVLDTGTGEVLTVPVRDYVLGSVASEMPVTWPDEALKAQAVASHSYALYQKQHADRETLSGAFLSADPARREGFMTDEVLRSYWGEAYAENIARLGALVDEVLDQVLYYGDEPAAACYHAISSGRTEASQNVWTQSLPYLQGVDSAADRTAADCAVSFTLTRTQMEDLLTVAFPDWTLPADPAEWFGAVQYTDAGYVYTQQVAGNPVRGTVLRRVLSLRSACFTIAWQAEEQQFVLSTLGYGHGVGLSQYGASAMALAGSSWADILAHYFPGTRVATLS
ncbi:MAG: SpoIID/LytB domain-containing protein [Oscillospiraceae bacterium]|nr:SpoIID/LytB domain-containing protein [Oscillospiraceae bacterium]